MLRLLGTVKLAWANMAIARKWSRKYEANEVTLFYGNLLSEHTFRLLKPLFM